MPSERPIFCVIPVRRCIEVLVRSLAIVLLALCPIVALAQEYDPAVEQELYRLANLERARAGLLSLKYDEKLQGAAREHSRRMAEAQQLSHQFGSEVTLSERLARTGAHFDTSGENVALDQTAEGAHRGLMKSPPHRANILSTEFNEIGIGVVKSGGSLYVTQDFVREFEKKTE